MNTQTKQCILCNKEFIKDKKNDKGQRWINRKYCSRDCQLQSIKGWNKGKTGYMSEEGRKKIAESTRKTMANETKEKALLRGKKAAETIKLRGTHNNGRLGIKGENDPLWKGEKANYNSKHRWIQNNWIKTQICEMCNKFTPAPPNTRLKYGTQWANISDEYIRKRSDWLELCPKCHKNYDNNK